MGSFYNGFEFRKDVEKYILALKDKYYDKDVVLHYCNIILKDIEMFDKLN